MRSMRYKWTVQSQDFLEPSVRKMNFDAAFRAVIIVPLESVVGRRLLNVNYWLMHFENPFFHVDTPNASGLAAVSLVFEGMTMEINPAWDHVLRDENNHHHIQLSVVPADNGGGELVSGQGLRKICADHSVIWRSALAEYVNTNETLFVGADLMLTAF